MKTNTKQNSSIHTTPNGWLALTSEIKGGKEWEIVTHTYSKGKGYRTILLPMFEGGEISVLMNTKKKATEEGLKEQHVMALILFDGQIK